MNAREQPLDVKDFIWLVTFDFETFQRITSTFPRERANSNFIEKKNRCVPSEPTYCRIFWSDMF